MVDNRTYRPNEKGIVERMIQYIRGSFFEGRAFTDVEDLNAQLDEWIEQCAHRRPHPRDEDRRAVAVLLDAERERLLPLPAHPPSTHRMETLRSGKRPYLRFDTNDYSIPHTLVRQSLTLVADDVSVRVMNGEEVVATHPRSYAKRQVIENQAHIDPLVAEKKRAWELRGRDRLRALCPHANALLEVIAARNEPVRHCTAKLNQLLDLYGAKALDAAIAQALESGAPAVGSVAYLLDKEHRRSGQVPPLAVEMSGRVRDKDVLVVPHDMSAYDALGRLDEEQNGGEA